MQLFDLNKPVVSTAELIEVLGVSRATVYRDLAQLERAGFLERVSQRGYALGTQIVELDRQIRLADPLLGASQPLMRAMARQTGGVVLLCRLQANKVMCIHQEPGPGATFVSYERGRAMPLYRGATSKIILANLPETAIDALWVRDTSAITESRLPSSLSALKKYLSQLRDARLCVTGGEVDEGVTGLAVPLLDGSKLLGSLSVVIQTDSLNAVNRKKIEAELARVARRIEARMEEARDIARHSTRLGANKKQTSERNS